MKQTKQAFFGDFKFDPLNQCVWRGADRLNLTPKAFAVFDHLLANRSRLVTKEELLAELWPDSYVTDAVLKVCVREIRKAMDDNPANPRFIQTFHRRGYRFIAPTHESPSEAPPTRAPYSPLLVGREGAQTKLETWLIRAMSGRPHIVFITGDPGAGKSALAEAFLQHVPNDVLVARGHALEQYGSGEAYMPILQAVTSLCKNENNAAVLRALQTYAPTWLAQMPSVAGAMNPAALQREVLGATRERMLREMAETIEALTADVSLVLLLEDLHWSDKSTIDLISYLARRKASARLLLIGTYRPVEVILLQHPLKSVTQELQLHGLCHELPLDFLSRDDVREYFDRRFSPNDFDPALAALIHSGTDGNPLFMVTEGEFLKNSGSISLQDGCWQLRIPLEQIEIEMPRSLRDLIERQINRISPESQSLLQVASVAGTKFSANVISLVTEISLVEVEEMCETLTRNGLFIGRGTVRELPDGTVASHYKFVHSLYQNVFYDLVPMGKRLRLHRRIGEVQEKLYGSSVDMIAAELALHFEEGRDYVRAAKYRLLAAHTASRRYAYREGVAYLKQALDLLGRLPKTERADLDLAAWEQLGLTRRSMGDMRQAADDLHELVSLAKSNDRPDIVVRALLYRASALSWLDREGCLDAAEQALVVNDQIQDEVLCAHVRGYCAYWQFLFTEWRDEYMIASEQAIEAAERAGHKNFLSLHVSRHSYFQCMTSNYDEAIRTADRGISLATEVGDFFDHAMAQFFKSWALLHSGRWNELIDLINEASRLAEKNEHYLWKTLFNLELAWLHQQCGSLTEAETLCRNALDHVKQTGHAYSEVMASTILGYVLLDQGHVDLGRDCLLDVATRTTQKRVLMDWIWEMPLRLGLATARYRLGDWENATLDAERALAIAQRPKEKTYMALACAVLAEISCEQGNLSLADDHSARAINLVETAELPMAAERVYVVAARIRQAQRRSTAAVDYRTRAKEIRAQLAHSLQAAPNLRDSLLGTPPETGSHQKHSGV